MAHAGKQNLGCEATHVRSPGAQGLLIPAFVNLRVVCSMSFRSRVRDRIMAFVLPVSGLQLRTEMFRWALLESDPAQSDQRSLNRFERKSFSQSGEDGILDEIFRRISVTNK